MLLIFNYLLYIVYLIYKYIGYRLVNHLFKKKLKKISTNQKNSSIDINFNKSLNITVNALCLDKFQNKNIRSVNIDTYKLVYNYKNNISLHIINNLEINIDESIENIDTKILCKLIYSKIDNLEQYIEKGLILTDKLISYIVKNQKIVIKNLTIKFNKCAVKLNNVVVYKNAENYKLLIKTIYFSTPSFNFIKLFNLSLVYKKDVYLSISKVDMKIIENVDTVLDLIQNFKAIYLNYNTDDEIAIIPIISINSLKLNFKNYNNIVLNITGLNIVHNSYLKLTYLWVKNYKKTIISIYGILYKYSKNELFSDKIELNLYESTCHKIYLSLNKFIKKKRIPKKHIDLLNEMSDALVNSYIFKKTVKKLNPNINSNNFDIDTSIYNDFPEDLTESFIVVKKNTNKLINSYLKKNYIKKTCINVHNLFINLYSNGIIRSKWNLKNIEYNAILNDEINIYINDWTIINNTTKLVENENKRKNILSIFYTDGKVELQFSTLILNLVIDEFIFIYNIIEKNVNYINKVLYSSYSLNYVGQDFFIKYFKLQQINCVVSYYPKKCGYYRFFGNMSELYKNIKYRNISLKLVYISIYYPTDFSDLLRTILRKWLVDIKKNQINNIINGTKFNMLIDNTPITITKNVFKSISKAISLLISLI
jgi:hypothetical protein